MRLAVFTLSAMMLLGLPSKQSAAQRTLSLPADRVMHLRSPDDRWDLIAPPQRVDGQHQLILLDRGTGRQRVVKTYNRSLTAAWNQDGTKFYMNEAAGSNIEEASLFFPGQGRSLSLNDMVLQKDGRAAKTARGSVHSYLHAARWIDRNSLLVEFCGDSDAIRFDYSWKLTLAASSGHYIELEALTHTMEPFGSSRPACKY